MPGGNRSGEFAASPNGRPDAPGTPDVKASNVNDNAAAKRGSGNGADKNAAGLDVTAGPPPAGAPVGENGGLIVQSPPLATKLAEPQQVATLTRPKINQIPENTNPEEAVFGGKRSYSLSLNMPNLASAGGSWVIRFAELAEDPAPGDLSAPVAIEKVDPKYPASMMRDGVEGSVTLYAVIRSDGSVGEVKVLRSLNDQLDENARAALAQWRFRPATKNGAPVDLEAVVTIPFKARALPF
jgi:TonB family protein